MSQPNIKFHHVSAVPTSGGTQGHVYFCSADGNLYICTSADGNTFEHYGKYTGGTGITVTPADASGNATISLNVSSAATALNGSFKTKQDAVSDPTADGTATDFIATLSQDTNGVITATKASLPEASTTVKGITTVGVSGGAAAYSHSHNYAGSSSAGGAATSANKVNKSLTVGTKTFDGSAAVTITAADLGLTGDFMHFLGTVTAAPTAATVKVNGASTNTTAVKGDVVVNPTTSKEYVFNGTSWIELGDESAFTTKTTAYNSSDNGVALGGTSAAPTITVTPGSIASGDDSVITGGAVYTAIAGLTDTLTGTAGAGKTITAFDQVDGKVTATFGNISITKSQVSDFPTSMTPTSHTHGNISNDGKVTADITLATGNASTGDYLLVSDTSASGTVGRGTRLTGEAGKFLTASGTWATPSYPTGFSITENLDDDDVVVLAEDPSGKGNNTVNIKATHAKKGPTGGFTPTATTATQTPAYGANATLNIPSVTVDEYGHVTSISNQAVTVKIPASDNTDTKVTSAANHYGYTASSGKTEGTNATAITTGTTKVITSVTLDDAKHVTGITSATLPAYPSVGNGTVTLTYADGTTDSFTLNQSAAKSVNMSDTWVEF